MKIRVLIVDDEFLLCEHIKRTIDWDYLDMEVAGMAYDGYQALEMIGKQQIQLVLTDISMPKMDGIELASRIQKEYPYVKVVIITGYGEFKYAQNAIRYGVKQYLLKPVCKDSYTEALLEVRKELMSTRNAEEETEQMRREKKSRKQWTVINEYSAGMRSRESFEEYLNEEEKVCFQGTVLAIAFLYKSISADWTLLNGELISIIRGWFENAFILAFREERGIIIITVKESERNWIIQELEQLSQKLEREKGINFYAGVSKVFRKIENLPMHLNQAERALSSRFVFADSKVIGCELVNSDETFVLSKYLNVEQMLRNFRKNDREELLDRENGINVIFQRLKKDNVSKESAVFTAIMCVSVMNEFLSETSFGNIGISTHELSDELYRKESIQEVQDFISMLVEKTLADVFLGENGRNSERILEAKYIIKENISNPQLSLQMVAEKLYLNKSYLSNLFRKETGQTMGDYIIQHRLAAVKQELDDNPTESLSIVAEKLGFNSEYYLIRCFKKQYGVTPGYYSKIKRIEKK